MCLKVYVGLSNRPCTLEGRCKVGNNYMLLAYLREIGCCVECNWDCLQVIAANYLHADVLEHAQVCRKLNRTLQGCYLSACTQLTA